MLKFVLIIIKEKKRGGIKEFLMRKKERKIDP